MTYRALLFTVLFGGFASFYSHTPAEDISGSGWKLWPDRQATWKDETLYFPSEIDLSKMPVNPPTGGWLALNAQQGIDVTLPTTVEEHFWGKFGTRPYAKNEAQKGPQTSFPNGNYLGVSWWWKQIQVPDFKPGQRVVVSFRGARLRAEVYCNGKLCGYTIMTELPFTADLTDAVKPGQPAQLTGSTLPARVSTGASTIFLPRADLAALTGTSSLMSAMIPRSPISLPSTSPTCIRFT